MITKKEIKEGVCKVLKGFLAKAEEKGITGEDLAKAWGPKPAGKKLPREKPSVFAVLEGHRPLKPGEKLQPGDKVVGKSTSAGQYHPDEVWETVHDKHPQLGFPVGTWTNVGKQYQRPLSPQATGAPPAQSPVSAASPSQTPAATHKPVGGSSSSKIYSDIGIGSHGPYQGSSYSYSNHS